MRGRDCELSTEMYSLIDELQRMYSIDNYDEDTTTITTSERVTGFINEVNGEIDDYGGDRKDRIKTYFISSISELLNE
mgnify:CR=1 FL=1|jgi:hypothetical protein